MTAIGIDLGTTNSVVAKRLANRDDVRVVKLKGKASTPSVVACRRRQGREDETLIGSSALNFAAADPQNTITSVKRLMGRAAAEPEVAEASARRPYAITAGPEDDPRAHVVMGGETYSPVQISTMILEHLRRGATETLGEEVTHAIITVPAYFREAQRVATRTAGEAAGLVVKRVIDEPTAAAIAFGVDQNAGEEYRVLVYDLGGGTFDISILNSLRDDEGNNFLQVLDYVGDNWLGGDDFDLAIVDRIIDWVKQECGVDPSEDPKFLFLAKEAAENAKLELSEASSTTISIRAAFKDADGLGDVEFDLTRVEFDAMIAPFVDRTMDLVHQALRRKGYTPDDITDVLMVGGSTLVPQVAERVQQLFGAGKVHRDIDPMQCVAMGAAILADTMQGIECRSCATVNDESSQACGECGESLADAEQVPGTVIYEVTGMALGVGAVDGKNPDVFVEVIPRGTAYPMPEPLTQAFKTTDEDRIRVVVYEGDKAKASENAEQGVIEVDLPAGVELNTHVEVSFVFDLNRQLQVTVSIPEIAFEEATTLKVNTLQVVAVKPEEPEAGDRPRQRLENTVRGMDRFLSDYAQFIEPGKLPEIKDHMAQARQALLHNDEAEYRELADLLDSDYRSTDLAARLDQASRTAAQVGRAEAESINATIANMQKAHIEGNAGKVHEQDRALAAMIGKARRETTITPIADAENYEGLLRKER